MFRNKLRFDGVATEKVTLPVLLSFLEIQHRQDHPKRRIITIIINRFSDAYKRNSWAGLFKARLSKPRISENFDFEFLGFLYIVCPSVASSNNLKLHNKSSEKHFYTSFNPGLVLTGFQTTRQ